jgi:putative SOS response-associated peptidase YedK
MMPLHHEAPMCGRYVRKSPSAVYAELFSVPTVPGTPSYNVAPTQSVAVVRQADDHREAVLMRWGLIPSWAKDMKMAQINARGDTVATKPMFRSAFKKRRCLVLADGYYEWKTLGKQKQPYYFHRRDDRPFAFAGLWETWKGPDGPVESCAIITTDANELSKPIHNRMPVILPMAVCDPWLDTDVEDAASLTELLKPYAADEMDCYAVNLMVGNPRNNSPACIERLP